MRGPWVGQNQWQPQQGPSHMRWQEVEVEEEQTNIWAVCDDCPPEEQAQAWLSNIANEEEDVKNHVLQQIMGTEGGF